MKNLKSVNKYLIRMSVTIKNKFCGEILFLHNFINNKYLMGVRL